MKIDVESKVEQILSSAERFDNPKSRDEIEHLLRLYHLPPNEIWIDYQQKYGGIVFRGYASSNVYKVGMFFRPPEEYRTTPQDSIWQTERDGDLILAGQVLSLPFDFYMDANGILYNDITPFASSIEALFKFETVGAIMLEKVQGWFTTSYIQYITSETTPFTTPFNVPKSATLMFLERVMSAPAKTRIHIQSLHTINSLELPAGFTKIENASDEHQNWWTNGDAFLEQSFSWGYLSNICLRAFAPTKKQILPLMQWLEQQTNKPITHIHSWPDWQTTIKV